MNLNRQIIYMKRKPLTYEQIFKMYKKLYKDDSEAELFYSKSIRLMHQIFQDVKKVILGQFHIVI